MSQKRAPKKTPQKVAPAPANDAPAKPRPIRPSAMQLHALQAAQQDRNYQKAKLNPLIFKPYEPPKHVVGNESVAAMDWCGTQYSSDDGAWLNNLSNFFADGMGFFGYPRLAEMALRTEYRLMGETLADECTREWIKITAGADRAKDDKVKEIEAEMKRLNVRAAFRQDIKNDCWFGMSHILLNVEGGSPETPLVIGPNGIKKGSLKSIKVIEAQWTSPQDYNAIDPTREDFYVPQAWMVMGKKYHASRLLTGISRGVSDILKPAFNFGGMSLSQMAKPYVDNFLGIRDSNYDAIKTFSIICMMTNLGAQMEDETMSGLRARIEMFNLMRSNAGTMVVDKETEDLKNLAVPLTGLKELQQQALEALAFPGGIPLIKLLGITPSGLNASGDGEIEVWQDHVSSYQEQYIYDRLEKIFQAAQLNIWGEIDPDISFEFVHLAQMSEETQAIIEKMQAETDGQYVQNGTILPAESRERVAKDRASMYNGINLNKPIPEPDPADVADLDGKDQKAPNDER